MKYTLLGQRPLPGSLAAGEAEVQPEAEDKAEPTIAPAAAAAPAAVVVTQYYYLGGTRVAMRQGGAVYYLISDHLGSTSTVIRASDLAVVGRQWYYPFGGSRASTGSLYTDRLYTGQRAEAGLGSLYDYNARFYSTVGRFISPDTIVPDPGDPQSLNRYAYARNYPLGRVDPTGHRDIAMDGGFDGAIAVAAGYALAVSLTEWGTQLGAMTQRFAADITAFATSPLGGLALQHAQQANAGAGQARSSGGMGGNPANLDPNDPRFRQLVDSLAREHSQHDPGAMRSEMVRSALDTIRQRHGDMVTHAGQGGEGADIRDVGGSWGADLTTFQKSVGSAGELARKLAGTISDKAGQQMVTEVHIQMNVDAKVFIQMQTYLDQAVQLARLGNLNAVYLYNAAGEMIAHWGG